MSMGMSMGFSMSQNMEQRQRQELTMSQRQTLVQNQLLTRRLELISALNGGERYHPEAECPQCAREMTPVEILKGFNTDPNDFTTVCTGCGTRFQPKLIWSNQYTRQELPFYCDIQTQAQMIGLETISPEDLRKEYPTIYHSAIAHHGLLKNAFAAFGITYGFDEVVDVKQKVEPFLGEMPDTVIAELSGLKVGVIRRMRRTAHIPAYTQQRMILDEETYA